MPTGMKAPKAPCMRAPSAIHSSGISALDRLAHVATANTKTQAFIVLIMRIRCITKANARCGSDSVLKAVIRTAPKQRSRDNGPRMERKHQELSGLAEDRRGRRVG